MMRTRCDACGADNPNALVPILDLGDSPLADTFPSDPGEPEVRYPLGLTVCTYCSFVQLTEVVPDSLLYGRDYGFYTGASPSAVTYFADYARWALGAFRSEAHRYTVEIASNDGTLLRHFAADGAPVLGVEPATGPAEASGLPTVIAPFGREVARDIGRGRAGLVIANNVIAHVADLADFVGGIAHVLAPDGAALIECQYLPDLLTANGFDHVYHEHRSFFSITTLARTLRPHGLRIVDWLATPQQGGSVRAVVRHASAVSTPWADPASERWLSSVEAYRGLQGRADRIKARLLELLDAEAAAGRRVMGFGASAKSTTLLNWCGIGPDRLSHIVDLTPTKRGRYTPGTHIPIVLPDDLTWGSDIGLGPLEPDTYLLLVHNYLSGVIRRERDFIHRGGRFIVPLPAPVLL